MVKGKTVGVEASTLGIMLVRGCRLSKTQRNLRSQLVLGLSSQVKVRLAVFKLRQTVHCNKKNQTGQQIHLTVRMMKFRTQTWNFHFLNKNDTLLFVNKSLTFYEPNYKSSSMWVYQSFHTIFILKKSTKKLKFRVSFLLRK